MTLQDADELTIPGILARAARRHGEATAVEDGSFTLSFAGLEAASLEAAIRTIEGTARSMGLEVQG